MTLRTGPVAPARRPPMPPSRRFASRTRLVALVAASLAVASAFGVGAVVIGDDNDTPGEVTNLPAASVAAAGGLTLGGSAVPADINVDGTTRLKDGSEVKVRVTAKNGVEIYGFEAFLCASGVTFELDADVRPDDTGNCASKPLSAGSDRYKQVKGSPPFQVVETTFRAGVGTDSYTTSEGTPVTITCGPGHPCQLVLKVQYPKGYGFRAYQLDFA